MDTKVCKQCGELKPLTQFRKYYGGRKGNYRTCKQCEKINSRAKYLTAKGDKRSSAENNELKKISTLWEAQRSAGLAPPKTMCYSTDNLDEMIRKYQARISIADTPAELVKWLHEPLTESPEYYQETIYDYLVAKYRPQTGIDAVSMLPVYDDTYREVLNQIAARFDVYEDAYYTKG